MMTKIYQNGITKTFVLIEKTLTNPIFLSEVCRFMANSFIIHDKINLTNISYKTKTNRETNKNHLFIGCLSKQLAGKFIPVYRKKNLEAK